MRKEFERCTPESVGIRSEAVLHFLDRMNEGFTEMHSLMIMRHDKICAEGWWAPYAPGLHHTMMSQSKTYTGTAVGIALREGILSLDEKLADIFPEYVSQNSDEKLKKITVRHLLCHGGGMAKPAVVDSNWLKNYFSTPVLHEPGTDFFYNDTAVTVLVAVIRKKTGLHILDYLKPRLFDKIGINSENLTWFNVGDGCAFGAGGLFCTTEDTLRLMKLYADGGVWEGERILDEKYVKEATSCRISTTKAKHMFKMPPDNQHGYGFLMWMSHVPGTFRAEGAFGQITLADPKRKMIISVTQSAETFPTAQDTMDRIWEFLDEIDPEISVLPENKKGSDEVKRRFSSLSLAAVPYNPRGHFPFAGETYEIEGGEVHPENIFYVELANSPDTKSITGISSFSFTPAQFGLVEMNAVINGCKQQLKIAVDGTRYLNILPEYYVSKVYLSGYWKDENTFSVRFRWIETVFEKELDFHFTGRECTITENTLKGIFPASGKPVKARIKSISR